MIPKPYRELSALLSANALSMVGNYLSVWAIPWFVYKMTGNAMATAGVVLAGQLPNLLVGLLGGHLIDRFSAKQISLFSDAVNFVAVMLIPILFQIGMLDMFLLTALVFFSQVMDVPGATARRVIVPDLIDRHRLPRERVNGLDSIVETGADLVGPILAGALLSAIGALTLLVFDAFTFLLSFFIVLFGVRSTQSSEKTEPFVSVWNSLLWMFKNKQVLKLGVYDLLINAVAAPLIAFVLPVIAKDIAGQSLWLGIWGVCFAAGTTLTTFAYTLVGQRLSSLQLLRWTPIGQAASLIFIGIVIGSAAPLWLIAIAMFVYGLNLGVGSMMDANILQTSVPAHRRGSVFAAFSSLRYAGMPVGLLVAGLLIESDFIAVLFLIMSLVVFVASLLWWRTKQIL